MDSLPQASWHTQPRSEHHIRSDIGRGLFASHPSSSPVHLLPVIARGAGRIRAYACSCSCSGWKSALFSLNLARVPQHGRSIPLAYDGAQWPGSARNPPRIQTASATDCQQAAWSSIPPRYSPSTGQRPSRPHHLGSFQHPTCGICVSTGSSSTTSAGTKSRSALTLAVTSSARWFARRTCIPISIPVSCKAARSMGSSDIPRA